MTKDRNAQMEEFAARLEAALGGNLVSLMAYGPAVRDEGRSAPTTLLVVRDASPAGLRPIEQIVASWAKKGNAPPLIFSEREWRDSADVFPIEIEDMRGAHRLLRGSDPLAGLETTREDLRRELEREVRGKLLQLRTEFAAVAADGKALGSLLTESALTFFVLFRAVLTLLGRTPPGDPAALVRAVAEATGLEAGAFEWILSRLAGKKPPHLKAYDPVGDGYVEQIERLAHFVNSYDVARTNGAPKQGSGT